MCLFCDPETTSRLNYRAAGKTAAQRLEGPADVVLRGGPILTMDELRPQAEAMSVRDGLVQFVGPLDGAMAHKARTTRVIDLGGKTVIPGMVVDSLPKDPLALLDWQDVDLSESRGDVKGHLARTVTPPLFSEPVFVRLRHAEDVGCRDRDFLQALDAVCASAPVAVQIADTGKGFANEAMLRLAGGAAGIGPGALDVAAMLRTFARHMDHSVASIERALADTVATARGRGFTTVMDRSMGSIAGRAEIEAAASFLCRKRQVRINAIAHQRLRDEWDGKLPPGTRTELLSLETALVHGDQGSDELQNEAVSLDRAGWRLVFVANDQRELETVVESCRALKRSGGDSSRRHRVEIGFPLDPCRVDELTELGVDLSIEAQGQEGPLILDIEPDLPLAQMKRRVFEVTRGAARRCGIEHVSGSISSARHADFTVLERPGSRIGTLHVFETWIDGIPVQ